MCGVGVAKVPSLAPVVHEGDAKEPPGEAEPPCWGGGAHLCHTHPQLFPKKNKQTHAGLNSSSIACRKLEAKIPITSMLQRIS